MNNRHRILLFILAFLFLTPHISKSRQVYAAVVINEVLPKPSDDQSEWIELYNSGNDSVSLNTWKLENTSDGGKSYILNASWIIPGKGFLLLSKSQTGINLSIEGDTVKLVDNNGTVADSQSYPGTLGFNTSIGRSTDGAGVWTSCSEATPAAGNKCPEPSVTPTSIMTTTPIATPVPTASPTQYTFPTLTAEPDNKLPEERGIQTTPTVSPTLSPDVIAIPIPSALVIPKTVLIQAAVVLVAWGILALIAYIHKKRRRRVPKNN